MKTRANHTNVRVGIMDNKDNEKDRLKLLFDEHFPEYIENDPAAVHSNQAFKSQSQWKITSVLNLSKAQ
ncbi:Hypothetical protein FKW44_010240 [Caligus rogercresseyi]|uniref:Uncharacterized protein n=1 Tax=Caligus rogercresseyi TaxID=217165 RepID=A0A7T8HGB1_CALRO|nr:Hypothetical protein FKW44_010240 [Caligus rogercresseyi]